MNFNQVVRHISEEFTDAWNTMDWLKISSCVANDVRLYSPYVSVMYPEKINNWIEGKDDLLNYWKKLVAAYGHFKVKQTDIVKVDGSIKTQNHLFDRNLTIQEVFTLNEYGKIVELRYEYLGPDHL